MVDKPRYTYYGIWWLRGNERRQFWGGDFLPDDKAIEYYKSDDLPFWDNDPEVLYLLNQGYKWRTGIDILINEIKNVKIKKIIMINDDCHTRLIGLKQGGDEWISNESTIFQDILEKIDVEDYLILDPEYGGQRYYIGSDVDLTKIKYHDQFTQSWASLRIAGLHALKRGETPVETGPYPFGVFDEIPYEKIKYKVVCVNKRPELHRQLACTHLVDREDVFLTNYSKWGWDAIKRGEYDREWCRDNRDFLWHKLSNVYKRYLTQKRDKFYATDLTWDQKEFIRIDSRDQDKTTQKHAESFLSLVTETLWHKDICFWSEKTKKAMLTKRPFILLAPAGTLRMLKGFGFKTFDKFWDESYDEIEDQGKRFEAVMKIVDQILELPMKECSSLLQEMHYILSHNYYHLANIGTSVFEHPEIPEDEIAIITEQRKDLTELLKGRALRQVDGKNHVAIFGDSWTEGYGVKQSWPEFLHSTMIPKNLAMSGSDNISIHRKVVEYLKSGEQPRFIVVAWSSIARRIKNYGDIGLHTYPTNFSEKQKADSDQLDFFHNTTIDKLFWDWENQIIQINELAALSQTKVLHFSVFGEHPRMELEHCKAECNNFYGSFIDILGKANRTPFRYELPMFEYDMANDANPMKEHYAEMFGKDWEYAVAERELLRSSKYFLDCGHPNEAGHKELANVIQEQIFRNM